MRVWKRFGVLAIILIVIILAVPVTAAPAEHETRQIAPTYRIFATREGLVGKQTANGHIIQPRDQFVALPSWRVLSSYRGYEFQVRLTYGGRTTVVPVWDVGPWNTNDDYWSPNRQNYRDLPVGLPMAQAAYLNGYNGGRDEFGRRINAPNGIDIADGTFWDSLGMSRNDWVEVTFLWLGQDPGPGNAVAIEPGPPPDPSAGGDAPAAPAPAPEPEPQDNPQVESGATAVDNSDSGYNASGGGWEESTCGLNGGHAWVNSTTDSANSQHSATWSPNLSAGYYEIKAYIPSCGSPAATQEARYQISHDGSTSEVTINQESAAGTWVSLGTYRFASGDQVELSNLAGDEGRAVRFDALAWTPRNDNTPPDATITNIARQRNGYLVQWGGEDDVSGIDTYDVQVQQLPKGGWRDWKMQTTETEAWFGPDEGKQFAFRVRARDQAGNEEIWPETADMDTTVVAPPEPEQTEEEQSDPVEPNPDQPDQPDQSEPNQPGSEEPTPEQPVPEQPEGG